MDSWRRWPPSARRCWARAGAWAQGGPPPALVRLDEVRIERVEQMRRATGELRPVRLSVVAGEEPGRVLELLADVGDMVEAGDVLARLDGTLLRISMERLTAERSALDATLAERRAVVEQEETDLRRLRDAVERGGVSSTEVEDAMITLRAAESRAATARADLAAADALIAQMRERIEKMTVRAPFSGQVVAKHTEVGQWLGEGGDVADIVELDTIDAWLDVPQQVVGALESLDAPVAVSVAALGLEVESEDVVVISRGDELARTFPVRVRLRNPDGRLRPGMSATGLIPTGVSGEVVTVHKDAILRDDAGVVRVHGRGWLRRAGAPAARVGQRGPGRGPVRGPVPGGPGGGRGQRAPLPRPAPARSGRAAAGGRRERPARDGRLRGRRPWT